MLLLAVAVAPWSARGTDAVYENFGFVGTPPDIDATTFINHGTFNIVPPTLAPFETQNTLNYTNKGTMTSFGGWRFEHSFINKFGGQRNMAASFVNENPGVVEALDFIGAADPLPCIRYILLPSYLFVGATNIITGAGFPADGASMTVGVNGWMQLVGQNVDLSDSGLQVLGVWLVPNGSLFSVDRTIYQPDVGVSDIYWEVGNFYDDFPIFSGSLWNGQSAFAQGGDPNAAGTPGFVMDAPVSDSYVIQNGFATLVLTNFTGDPTNVFETNITRTTVVFATNLFKHAAFAQAPPQFTVEIGFDGSRLPRNPFQGVDVRFTATLSNVVTQLPETATIHVQDTLAADNFFGLAQNIVGCNATTFIPMTFLFERLDLFDGVPNSRLPESDFYTTSGIGLNYPTNIFRDSVTNTIVEDGDFANYAAFFDNLMTRPPAVSGGNETNYPGRVRVFADNLNMENTRIRGEGQVYLQTDHLVSSAGAIVDCENISLNLGSTNGSLKVESIIPSEVQRLRGAVQAWSAVWTNSVVVMFTNYTFTNIVSTNIVIAPPSTNAVTNIVAIFTPTTNIINVAFAATMVNGANLATILNTTVYEAGLHGRDITIEDDMSVTRKLTIDGRSLTLNGDFTIPGFYPFDPVTGAIPPDPVIEDWSAAIAANLVFFTNNGTMNVANRALFGIDRVTPYAAFVNNGSISAAALRVRGDYFENSGSLLSQGVIEMNGGNGKLEGGDSAAATGTSFDVNNLKFNQYQILSDGPLVLSVKNELSDAGGGSGNLFSLSDGFQMPVRPKKGGLLGTAFVLEAPANAAAITINSTWAAENRGASAAGYVDNAAIGQLVLHATNHPLAKFRFTGVGAGQRALYVDMLDLEELGTNYASQLLIQPNITIYYAAAKLGFTPPLSNGVTVLPEEFLDGKFNGRLRWVKTFAGPNSSTPVVVNGQTHIVNTALFNSHLIDSDGDGVPNSDDGVPPNGDKFKASTITVNVSGNGTIAPNHNAQSLLIGHVYSMLALPSDGASFAGWSGSTSSASATLTFVMQSNLTFTANFTYAPVAGTYRGLFYEPAGVQFLKSGAFQAVTTTGRGISGSLQIGKNRYSFKGTLSTAGALTVLIPRSGNTSLTLQLQAGAQQIVGTVGDGSWTANLIADRAVFSKSNPTSLAGRYTLNVPGNGDETITTTPHGDGFGAATVTTAGAVSLKGSLADGEKITQSSAVSESGQWPLYTSLYGGSGQLLGWMTFANTGGADVDGPLSWIKQANPVAKYYPAGFDVEPASTGSRYDSTKSPATGFADGFFTFTGGNLSTGFMNDVAFVGGNKIVNFSANKLKYSLKSDGTFSGSVTDPSTGGTLKYSGALLQKQGFGAGYFLGTDQSGKVLVAP